MLPGPLACGVALRWSVGGGRLDSVRPIAGRGSEGRSPFCGGLGVRPTSFGAGGGNKRYLAGSPPGGIREVALNQLLLTGLGDGMGCVGDAQPVEEY